MHHVVRIFAHVDLRLETKSLRIVMDPIETRDQISACERQPMGNTDRVVRLRVYTAETVSDKRNTDCGGAIGTWKPFRHCRP